MKASPSDTLIRETRALAQTTPYRKQKKPKSKKSKRPRHNPHGLPAGAGKTGGPAPKTFTPWMSLLRGKHSSTIKSKIHHEIVAFDSWVAQTDGEKAARRIIVECIENLVNEHIANDATVKLFGSSATGLCLPTSDIDIVVTTPQRWGGAFQNRVLAQLSRLLVDVRLTSETREIRHPNVPILKFTTTPEFGLYKVDITINHGEGSPGNDVDECLAEMPALRPLVMVLKMLVAKHGLKNPAFCGMGSYAITCMCIYFLKANPFQRQLNYFTTPYVSESLGTLLCDFLWHFSVEFPFSAVVISPRDGKLYPKLELEGWGSPSAMNLQCLVHPENNVTMFVNQKAVETLITVFRQACHDILRSTLDDRTILGKIITFYVNALRFRWNIHKMMDKEGLDASAANLMWRAKSTLITINEDEAQDKQDPGLLSHSSSGSSYHEGYCNHFASNASHRIA